MSESPFQVSEEELMQYAARGTIVHKRAELLLANEYSEERLLKECPEEFKLLEEGSLKMNHSSCNVEGFIKEYSKMFSWQPIHQEVIVSCDKIGVAGQIDLIQLYNGELAICDWKTFSSIDKHKREKTFKQLAAYAYLLKETLGMEVKHLVLMPLKPSNKKGYGAPISTTEIDYYLSLFMEDLLRFKRKYNLI